MSRVAKEVRDPIDVGRTVDEQNEKKKRVKNFSEVNLMEKSMFMMVCVIRLIGVSSELCDLLLEKNQ